jgi:hypothetical protein
VDAASLTKEEFFFHVGKLKKAVEAEWDDEKFGGPPIFMWDNVHSHNLTPKQLRSLKMTVESIETPAPYSGDFMQAIEHVHALICSEFHKQRFQKQLGSYNVDQDFALLKQVFESKVTAESVTNACKRVVKLVQHIKDKGTGGYAPSRLV